MGDSLGFLKPIPAVMIRQRTQLLEQLCAACEKQNEYKISAVESTGDAPDDSVFKSLPTLLQAKEESTCMCRFCCGRMREFTMTMNGVDASGGQHTYINLERPFKCSILCFCCLLNPQMIIIKDAAGQAIGTCQQDYRCIDFNCFPGLTMYFQVKDASGAMRYILRHQFPTLCNGCRNCCAPTCFNAVFEVDIFDATQANVVGMMKNIWPGCKFPRCATDATNMTIDFPGDASAEDKALLMGSLMLLEYMYWEKQPGQDG